MIHRSHALSDPGATGLSVGDAATRLGVSEKTVRRWIKAGRLQAELEAGKFGPQYRVLVPLPGLAGAVPADADPRTIALTIAAAIDERQAPLRDEIDRLGRAVQDLTRAIEALLQSSSAEPARGDARPSRPRWRLLGAR